MAKLDEAAVQRIRALNATMMQKDIAEMMGVSKMTVSLILSGKVWGWLPSIEA